MSEPGAPSISQLHREMGGTPCFPHRRLSLPRTPATPLLREAAILERTGPQALFSLGVVSRKPALSEIEWGSAFAFLNSLPATSAFIGADPVQFD